MPRTCLNIIITIKFENQLSLIERKIIKDIIHQFNLKFMYINPYASKKRRFHRPFRPSRVKKKKKVIYNCNY